jgi:hypothetical protein
MRLEARVRPASYKHFRHCPRSQNQTRRTRVPFPTTPYSFRLPSAFPVPSPLLPQLRTHPQARRGRHPNPPCPLLLKHLVRPKRRSRLQSRQNVRHMRSRSLMTLIGLCLVAVSRRRRLWSGVIAYLPPLDGHDGTGGSLDSLLPCLTLSVDNVYVRRSKEGVQTTSIELATKVLDSNGESFYEAFRGSGMILIVYFYPLKSASEIPCHMRCATLQAGSSIRSRRKVMGRSGNHGA